MRYASRLFNYADRRASGEGSFRISSDRAGVKRRADRSRRDRERPRHLGRVSVTLDLVLARLADHERDTVRLPPLSSLVAISLPSLSLTLSRCQLWTAWP